MTATKPALWIAAAAIVMASLTGCTSPASDETTATESTDASTSSSEPESQGYTAPGESPEVAPDGAEEAPESGEEPAPPAALTVEQAQTACNTALEAGYPGSSLDWAGGIQLQETDPESGAITFVVSGDIAYQESEDRGSVMTCSVAVPESAPEVTTLEVA